MFAFKPVAGVVFAASLALAGGVSAKELTIALASEPTAMDPHFHNLGPNNSLATHIFDSLILTDEKQALMPGLATSWKPITGPAAGSATQPAVVQPTICGSRPVSVP